MIYWVYSKCRITVINIITDVKFNHRIVIFNSLYTVATAIRTMKLLAMAS